MVPCARAVNKSVSIVRRAAYEIAFAAVTLYAARPAFASLHLPLQDIPQHMAAISVLKRYAFDASLRQYFELTLSRTQYLLVYLLGVLLSVPFGVEYATRLLVALTVVSIPYALRFALRRTGGDERMAVLAWPFAWNPQMMFGFLNFLLGIPIALVAIGLFADRRARTTRRRQVQLALLALAAFYSHLIPYGLLGLGALLLLDTSGLLDGAREVWSQGGSRRAIRAVRALGSTLWARGRQWAGEIVFLLPSLVALVLWVLRSPARDPAIRAGGIGTRIQFTWPDRLALPGQFRETILNIQGPSDEWALIAWGLSLMAALALVRASEAPREVEADSLPSTHGRIAWLPLVCAALYVFAPESYGWIWPIHTRFAVAAVLLLPLAFARTRHHVLTWAMMGLMAWASVGITHAQVVNFQLWDRDELGDLDAALAHARPGRRLIALVPATQSAHIPSNVPLLHVAAYYQVRGGDVATFSFVDFPQSPFRYRENGPRPARLRPRWEWQTSLHEADPNYDYYDYVLTRGWMDEPARMPERYVRIYHGSEWSLYERRR